MPQQYLDATVFANPVYETNFGPVIAAYSPPLCPATFDGATQVYSLKEKTCTTLPKSAFTDAQLARSSGKCGVNAPHGGPFLKDIDGQCYSTNDCFTSGSFADSCINAQQLPVRQIPFSSPGAIVNNVFDGNVSDWWRFM
jgi:hypothetical protein